LNIVSQSVVFLTVYERCPNREINGVKIL
jgi:hypothetical protein